MKRVLITAGQVYGRLDDNKLLGNRIRGIWAVNFARYLAAKDYEVTLLIPDTMPKRGLLEGHPRVRVMTQDGFESYRDQCYALAETHDSAVMSAAVVNWIPADPIKGKMSTKGYKEGDHISIRLVLAERVINRMREINPKLTLIGCKMLSGGTDDDLFRESRTVFRASRSHVIVANDLRRGLRRKLLVYPDRCVHEFNNDWDGFYRELTEVIDDEYWRTEFTPGDNAKIIQESGLSMEKARKIFDTVADIYRDRFTARDGNTVHGAILVPVVGGGYLCTPRVKGPDFTSADAVWVAPETSWLKTGGRVLVTGRGTKASLNAPLLARVATGRMTQDPMETGSYVVLHLHEPLEGVPTLPYAPPGTVRDNERKIPDGAFNIEGHGFIARLAFDGTIMKD